VFFLLQDRLFFFPRIHEASSVFLTHNPAVKSKHITIPDCDGWTDGLNCASILHTSIAVLTCNNYKHTNTSDYKQHLSAIAGATWLHVHNLNHTINCENLHWMIDSWMELPSNHCRCTVDIQFTCDFVQSWHIYEKQPRQFITQVWSSCTIWSM